MKTPIKPTLSRDTVPGFTLIELLVVMAIIAILAALSMGAFTYAQQAAARNKTTASLAAIKAGLEGYKEKFGEYPQPTTKDYSTGFVQGSGAQMLYQAITGDGTDAIQLTVQDGGASDGEVLGAEKEKSINSNLPPALIYPPRLTMKPGMSGPRFLVDGFGRPFLYVKAPDPDAINPTFDLWSYGNYDPRSGTPSSTITTKRDPAAIGTWVKNW